MLARSNTKTGNEIRLSHHSTRDWRCSSSDAAIQRLSFGDVACWSLDIVPKGLKLPPSFTLSVAIDGKRTIHKLPLTVGEEIVRLPIFPSGMSKELERLRAELGDHSLPKLTHIHGRSGTGKSRLLLELLEEARRSGLGCQRVLVSDGGNLSIATSEFDKTKRKTREQVPLSEFLRLVPLDKSDGHDELVFIDDIHNASRLLLQELLTYAFSSSTGVKLIVAGRSDSSFARPDYEAFRWQISEYQSSTTARQIILGELSDAEVRTALSSLFREAPPSLIEFANGSTKLAPIDLVHAIYSLLERNQINWADEDRLTLSLIHDTSTDYFSESEMVGGVLEIRYEHLKKTIVDSFSLAGFLEVLAAIDDGDYSYSAVQRLFESLDTANDLIFLWLEIDDQSHRATFRHNSQREFLRAKFYSFASKPRCREVLNFIGVRAGAISQEVEAAFAYSDGNLKLATTLISLFARRLRLVTNISSLNLHETDYQHLSTLFAILTSANRSRSILLHRCLIARAYLNSHHRAYALGFIDNLRLVGLVSALPKNRMKNLSLAGVKQVMAHALINSGDSRTALALMHEVENALENEEKRRSARAIEFDMCDRLQSYYAMQSAFAQAKQFFLRARTCAHCVKSPALLSVSFSAEFHLTRYLDVENASRLAERQLKHALRDAPPRILCHARVNDLVANWVANGHHPDAARTSELSWLRYESRRSGYGHLVPRIDYLLAVDALLRWRLREYQADIVDAAIARATETARMYGYSEYIWLSESLHLIKEAEGGAKPDSVGNKAVRLIDHLHQEGLTFIAGDELCFQNTVVLSNALRAIHQNLDQDTAWCYAKRISFSPLFMPSPEDQRRRIESVFGGAMLNQTYDERALWRDTAGYAVILV